MSATLSLSDYYRGPNCNNTFITSDNLKLDSYPYHFTTQQWYMDQSSCESISVYRFNIDKDVADWSDFTLCILNNKYIH